MAKFGASRLGHLPFGPSVSASCACPCDDGYNASSELTLPHDPGSRAAAMLAVATWPHGCVAILADEATLFRKLRTSCDARPGRILRAAPRVMSLSPKCITVTATTSCRTRTIRISCRGRLQDLHAARNQGGGPGQLHPLVLRRIRRHLLNRSR